MTRYNLIDEPWISVMVNEKGETKKVSLSMLFEHAADYKRLAGDTPTQDFAVFRMLLAILHTVFSRFDSDGEPYEYLELDDQFRQLVKVDENDMEDYEEALYNSWDDLWKKEAFPTVVQEYLNQWRERFYLFDATYPFYQVTEGVVVPGNISKTKPSSISGKNMNRLISESGNKTALFSPKTEAKKNKEILADDEIARWLITFQGYSGLSDKVIFGKEKYKASKGWIFDIGGVYLEGKTLYETLLLNLALVHPREEYRLIPQNPCWENESGALIEQYFSGKPVDNLAELYTNWSRAIYIDPNIDTSKPFSFGIVKLPEINHQDQTLELMTMWRYNEQGENKDTHTPRKHRANQSVWRSFGLLAMPRSPDDTHWRPEILDWFNEIQVFLDEFHVTLHAVSMKDDGNATSWVPIDEITDRLNIHDMILSDVAETGWVPRINDAVETTKAVIGYTYKSFLVDIYAIRNLPSSHIGIAQRVEELYYAVDVPFREWLASIEPSQSMNEKIAAWEKRLKQVVQNQAKEDLAKGTYRDYKGMEKEGQMVNIITAHNKFNYYLNQRLGKVD